MTTRRALLDDESTAPPQPVTSHPTVLFDQPTADVIEGGTVIVPITWTSVSAGPNSPIRGLVVITGAGVVENVSDPTLTSGTAQWRLSNATTGDNGTVLIGIVDDSFQSDSDELELTVEPAAAGAPIVTSAAVTNFELPLGSEGTIDFLVVVPSATPGKPAREFQMLLNGIDVGGDGVFSPLPSAIISPDVTALTWSTATKSMVNDQQTLTLIVIDDDGLEGSAATMLNLLTIDPLKELAGHPVQKLTRWIFPPINVDLDPVIQWNTSPIEIVLPLGVADTVLAGWWEDAETTEENPLHSISIFRGTEDVTADGVLDPGDITAIGPELFSWATSSLGLTDHGQIYQARIEDGDSLTDTSDTVVVLPYDDVLKELAGHPNAWAYGWSTPTPTAWLSDQESGGGTWVVSTSGPDGTEYRGGIAPPEVTTPTSSFLDINGGNAGTYQIRHKVHVLDNNHAWRYEAHLDGVLVSSGMEVGPQTSGVFTGRDGFTSTTLPITAAPGQRLEVSHWSEAYDPDAELMIDPLGLADRAFVTLTDYAPGPVETPIRQLPLILFDYEADPLTGRFTGPDKETYDADLPPNGSQGRPNGNNLAGPPVAVGRFEWPINFELPVMKANNVLQGFHEVPPQDGHCMLRCRMPGNPHGIESSTYLKSDHDFEMELVVDIVPRDGDAIGEARRMQWGILWQLHAGSFPAGWSGNPQLCIQIDDGFPGHVMRLHIRGNVNDDPTLDSDYTHTEFFDIERFWSGRHHFVMQWRQNYKGEGTYVRLWHGGRKVFDRSGMPIGLNHSALGAGNSSGQTTFGAYGWSHPDPATKLLGRPLLDINKMLLRGNDA